MSEASSATFTIDSDTTDLCFKDLYFLYHEATTLSRYVRCPDCPTPPVMNWDEVNLLRESGEGRAYEKLKLWAVHLRQSVRCPVCPTFPFPDVLYDTGSCDHKFCEYCMYQRNFKGKMTCCVCDVKLKEKNVKVDEFYSRMAVNLRIFIEQLDNAIGKAKVESESLNKDEMGTEGNDDAKDGKDVDRDSDDSDWGIDYGSYKFA